MRGPTDGATVRFGSDVSSRRLAGEMPSASNTPSASPDWSRSTWVFSSTFRLTWISSRYGSAGST